MMGAFLLGCLVGACGVLMLTGLALWFVDVRMALREGTDDVEADLAAGRYGPRLKARYEKITGVELERNRKREETR